MKVSFLSLHPEFGGAASANANIIKMLCQLNEVFFIDEYPDSTQKCFTTEITNLSMIDFPIGKYKYSPWKIVNILDKIKPDYIIIGFHFLLIFYWPVLLKYRLRGCKIITVFHSLTLGENFKAYILNILVSFAALVCDHLVFVSDYTRISWNKFPWIKSIKSQSVIFNAVNISNYFQRNNNISTIAYIGRLSKEKRPEMFCQLAMQAHFKHLPYKFIIWGDGPLKDTLLIKYSKYINFKGVSYDKDTLYSDVDLLILTSSFENCPMVVLEAKIRGIPAICPLVGGIPEIITDGSDGRLLTDLSLNKILNEITIINKDYQEYSSNCLQNSSTFSIDTLKAQWNKIIKY